MVFGIGGRVKGFSGSSIIYPVEVVSITDSVVVVVSIWGLVGYVIGSSGTSMIYPVLVVSMGSFSVLVITSFLVVGSEVTDIAVDNIVVGNEEEGKMEVVVGTDKRRKQIVQLIWIHIAVIYE